jgi:Flp pilus assembly protein TadD
MDMRIWLVPALLCLLGANIAGAEARWIRLRSANLEMYTTAGEKRARETLGHFEQVRSFFSQALASGKSTPLPVRIVLFGSRKEYEPYRINEFAMAYYMGTAERDYIVLSQAGPEAFPVAVHEYAHLIMQHGNLKLPPWLDEGMAELYSTLRPMGDKIMVGDLIAGRLQALLQDKWVPLATILAAGRNSPYYNEKDKAGSLYNEGWALAHMLVLSNAYRAGFRQLLAEIQAGTGSEEALTKTYQKPLAQVEKELREYLRGDSFRAVLFPLKLEKPTGELPSEPAPSFDVQFMLADLTDRPGREQEAQKKFEQLALAEPQRSETYTALGYLAGRRGRLEDARRNFEKAFELGTRNPRMLWDYGRMTGNSDIAGSIRILKRLLGEQPERVDVRLELADLQLTSKRSDAALEMLKPVRKVDKEQAPRLFRILAYANLEAGNREEARIAARRFQEVAETSEHKSEAARLLDYLDKPVP